MSLFTESIKLCLVKVPKWIKLWHCYCLCTQKDKCISKEIILLIWVDGPVRVAVPKTACAQQLSNFNHFKKWYFSFGTGHPRLVKALEWLCYLPYLPNIYAHATKEERQWVWLLFVVPMNNSCSYKYCSCWEKVTQDCPQSHILNILFSKWRSMWIQLHACL